jgi:anaerobic selenocysteine-containing dehydrogenase
MVRIASPHGQIELPVIVTKDIVAGVLAVPHGWSHKGTGGWRLANGAGGANVNRLMSSAPEDLEAGQDGAVDRRVSVRVSRS